MSHDTTIDRESSARHFGQRCVTDIVESLGEPPETPGATEWLADFALAVNKKISTALAQSEMQQAFSAYSRDHGEERAAAVKRRFERDASEGAFDRLAELYPRMSRRGEETE